MTSLSADCEPGWAMHFTWIITLRGVPHSCDPRCCYFPSRHQEVKGLPKATVASKWGWWDSHPGVRLQSLGLKPLNIFKQTPCSSVSPLHIRSATTHALRKARVLGGRVLTSQTGSFHDAAAQLPVSHMVMRVNNRVSAVYCVAG